MKIFRKFVLGCAVVMLVTDFSMAQEKAKDGLATASQPGAASSSSATKTLSIEYPRPLRQALWELQVQYGILSSYEDPPYQAEVDLETKRAENGKMIPRPARSRLEVPYRIQADGKPADPVALVEALVQDHHRRGNPGQFEVRSNQGRIEVVPAAVADRGGKMALRQPLMDLAVAGPSEEVSISEALDGLVASLEEKSGAKVELFYWEGPVFGATKVGRDPQGGPARDVLAQILAPLPLAANWALIWEPHNNQYRLIITPVRGGNVASRH